MHTPLFLLIIIQVILVSNGQFVTTYSPSVFQNIGLGEPPNGVHIPQDSFLNVLRNPTYRNSWILSPQTYTMPNYLSEPVAFPAIQTEPNQDSVLNPDSSENVDGNPETSRSQIYMRPRISIPIMPFSTTFNDIGLGEAPPGVYIPPDSLFNVLRQNPAIQRNPFTSRGTEALFVQPPEPEKPQNLVPESGEDNGARSTPKPARRTQPRRVQAVVRPTSMALDASMEYPSNEPMENRRPHLPRSNVEYSDNDFEEKVTVVSSFDDERKPRRRISRRRKQNGVRPPPSVFENVGLGEAPPGIHIPGDSLLNLLKEDSPRRRTRPSSPASEEVFVEYEEPVEVERRVPERQNRQRSSPRRPPTPAPEESYVDYEDPVAEERPVPARANRQRPSSRRQPMPAYEEEYMEQEDPVAEERQVPARPSRQRSSTEEEEEPEVEFGTRLRHRDPVLTFRQSSELRQRSHRNRQNE